jgi:chemotaxis protein CheZ
LNGIRDVQRKVFRIEETLARGRPPMTRGVRERPASDSFVHEGAALRETLARQARELSALLIDGNDRRMARAAGELGAVAEAMEKSAHTILKSAESIDSCLDKLFANAMDDDARCAARNLQNELMRIYEACNFQDLAGQRIGKAIETLCRLDDELSRMLTGDDGCRRSRVERSGAIKDALLNGPRLDGEAGHVSQGDIDALFD